MQRPLEKLGWHKRIITDTTETYYKGINWLSSSIYVKFNTKNGSIVTVINSEDISLQELLAIYNTAKQIKDESEC